MNREELYKIACDYNLKQRNGYYKVKKVDSQWVELINELSGVWYSTWLRIQNSTLLTSGSFSVIIKPFEKNFKYLVVNDLKRNYDDSFTIGFKKFYPTDYRFDINIETDEDWQTFLDEFDKCLKFYETEIFPKLTDIKFLAQYVGVPWEDKQNIVVGGGFPISFFKKLAILKWGGQEDLYHIYKKETLKLIEKYAIKKPDKYKAEFMDNFEKLINHLENEPNPFEEKKIG